MRITGFDTSLVELPLAEPLKTSIHQIERVVCLLLSVDTDEGVRGEGYAFGFDLAGMRAVEEMTKGLATASIGQDPLSPEAIFDKNLRRLNFYGQAGVAVHAMTPIDVACWDIVGMVAGLPLYRLFGGGRDRVAVYASGGLWLSRTIDELQAEAKAFLAQGFKAMKLRLGSAKIATDIERVAAVRAAIGEDVTLMADANQGLTVDHAIRLGRELERYNLAWFEEPVPTWDHAGHAHIAAALDTPIASGETEYLCFGLARMIEKRSADILMPDLQRMGGYTDFRRAVGQMAAAEVPFSPHIFTEHSLHLCAASGAIYAEHMPWFEPLFNERMTIDEDGMVAIPTAPGVGFTFDWDGLEPHRVT